MAHELQVRYAKLVDAKLRAALVTKDRVIFNTKYEGDPKAGAVKIPVRDGEVASGDYVPTTGKALSHGSTAYLTCVISNDIAVNELIDGYQAAAVPDGLVADRLDSAGYSLGLDLDQKGLACLVGAETAVSDATSPINGKQATVLTYDGSTAAKTLSASNVYEAFVTARKTQNKANVPTQGRYAIVDAEVESLILLDKDNFIKKGDLSQELVMTGAIAMIAGYAVYTSNNIPAGANITVSSTAYIGNVGAIFGHMEYATRVREWSVLPHVQDLAQSGTFIGACAVQGRQVYEHKVTKPQAFVLLKYKGDAVSA